jgi:hypothetical protein
LWDGRKRREMSQRMAGGGRISRRKLGASIRVSIYQKKSRPDGVLWQAGNISSEGGNRFRH